MKKEDDCKFSVESAEKYHWPKQEEILLLKPYLDLIGNTKNKKILDVGCGSGWITEILAKSAKKVVGIDNSEKMIEMAKSYSKNPKIEYKVLDATSLSDIRENFDVITCAFMLQLITPYRSMVKTLKDCNKLLKRGGYMVILIPHPCFVDKNKREYSTYTFLKKFNYFKQEQKYEVCLSSKKGKSKFTANFYNLNGYFNAFKTAKFLVSDLVEPEVPDFYKNKYKWTLELEMPFFLILKLIKK